MQRAAVHAGRRAGRRLDTIRDPRRLSFAAQDQMAALCACAPLTSELPLACQIWQMAHGTWHRHRSQMADGRWQMQIADGSRWQMAGTALRAHAHTHHTHTRQHLPLATRHTGTLALALAASSSRRQQAAAAAAGRAQGLDLVVGEEEGGARGWIADKPQQPAGSPPRQRRPKAVRQGLPGEDGDGGRRTNRTRYRYRSPAPARSAQRAARPPPPHPHPAPCPLAPGGGATDRCKGKGRRRKPGPAGARRSSEEHTASQGGGKTPAAGAPASASSRLAFGAAAPAISGLACGRTRVTGNGPPTASS
jgi:hypothetical protein